MRVGDYKFDNTNWTGANAAGPRYDLRSFPIEDENPLVLRQYLWLATDSAFKGSLQSIARKRAALRNVTVNEQLPDFAPAQPSSRFTITPRSNSTQQPGTIARAGSPPYLTTSPASALRAWNYSAIDSLHRFVNNEGTSAAAGNAWARSKFAPPRRLRRHDRARSGHVLHARPRDACSRKRN